MSTASLLTTMEADTPAQLAPRRFWVDQGPPGWLVAEGGIDLFLQRRSGDGAALGALHHYMRALPGQVFFGLGSRDLPGDWSLVAVALPGTRLHVLSSDFFGRSESAEAILNLCETWVSLSAESMTLPPAPRQCLLIDPGAPLECAGGVAIRSTSQVAWVEVAEGNALWLENPAAVFDASGGLLPLPRDLWLMPQGSVKLRQVNAVEMIINGTLLSALAGHQRFVLGRLAAEIERSVEEEHERLEAKEEQSLLLAREAIQKLLSVVTETDGIGVAHAKWNSCFAACQATGRQAGIEFRMPPPLEFAAMNRDPIAAIASASHVRYRRVALKGEWWTGDNGPLVGSFAESGEWVALLSRSGGYDIYYPESETRESLTEEIVANLLPFGVMFYRVFPDRVLRLRDLGAFAIRGRSRDLAQVLILGMLCGLLGMVVPIATGALVDSVVPSADVGALWQMVGALAVAAIATALFELTRSIAALRIEGKMDSSLQAALWDRVLKLPVPFFRNYSAGDLALRINGVNTIRRAMSRTTIDVLLNGLFSIFNLLLLFYFSPSLAVVAVLLVGAALTITLGIGVIKLGYERQLSDVGGRLSSTVFQYLNGISKLRMGAAEGRAFANWAEIFSRYRGLQFNAQHWGNVEHTILSGYTTLATALLFAVIGLWLVHGAESRLSTGEFIAFSAAFGTFFGGMIALAETLLNTLNLIPVFERAKPILETIPESDEGKGHAGELLGGLEVANVSFQYGDGPEILKGVSFLVRPGGYVALVGPSGSGKSTLLRLLLAFEKPSAGTIYYDNQDLSTVDVQSVRRQLGVVLQNGQLIPGDIYTNIVGASTLTLDDAWEAARMVGLDEDISQMPMGMHTVIGEGASTLSGGQRQRILIARAIVHRPRLIFFDEATSALDNRTQAIVTRSLEQLKVTRIVIAHRLSTIVNADQIIVLRDGKIEQTGNYETLIKEPGLFADLARRQIA